MILLFTYKCDAHPSRVLDILEGWGISVFRLNTEAIITDYLRLNKIEKDI